VIIGSAVIPTSFVLLWRKATALGAICGSVIGMILGVTCWLISAAAIYGEVSLASTGGNFPMLIGNLVSILTGGAICTGLSLWRPDNCDWESTRQIALVEDDYVPVQETDEELVKYGKWVRRTALGFTFAMIILIPCIALAFQVYPIGFWWFWVVMSIIWSFIATIAIIGTPIIEGRHDLLMVIKGLSTCTVVQSKVHPNLTQNPEPEMQRRPSSKVLVHGGDGV